MNSSPSALEVRPSVQPIPGAQPRVAIIGRLSSLGGVQSVILSLIKGLNQRGITPDVAWDLAPNADMLRAKGVRAGYQPVSLRTPSFLLDQLPITGRWIMEVGNLFSNRALPQPYDFYYIFYNGFLVTDGTPHVRYLNGPPLLPQLDMVSPGLRGVPYRLLRQMYRLWLRDMYPVYEFHRDSTYVINSEYTARLFEQAHGVRLPVVHPPIDLTERSFSADDLAQRDTITFFSRFIDYKRPEMVLDLAKQYPERRFVLMGGVKPQSRPYYEGLRLRAQATRLANVSFFDNPSDAKVKEELARTRVFVFPGVNEHFGMATAEAIASGALPFVHDSGGQQEIVPDERLRFNDDQFHAKFAALLALATEEQNAIRFRLREHVAQYSEDAFNEKMLAFIPLFQPAGSPTL